MPFCCRTVCLPSEASYKKKTWDLDSTAVVLFFSRLPGGNTGQRSASQLLLSLELLPGLDCRVLQTRAAGEAIHYVQDRAAFRFSSPEVRQAAHGPLR